MNEIPFGEWLKRQRKASGWTQEQLADKIGCSAIAIRKFESEERRPSLQIIERLAHIFHVPANEQAAFVRFARGDWSVSPSIEISSPWTGTNPPPHVRTCLHRLVPSSGVKIGYLYRKIGEYEKAQECLARCREVCTEHGLTKTLT